MIKRAISTFLLVVSCCGTLMSATPSERSLIEHFNDKLAGELTYAALKGNAKKMDAAIAAGADINRKGDQGLTPLMVALLQKNKNATLLLLKRKSNPNLQNDEGYSPMSEAAGYAKDSWFLETLLKNGGNPNLNNEFKGRTLLFEAIDASSTVNINILLKAGANINYRENVTGNTPVLDAVIASEYNIVLYLLEAGADPTIKDHGGQTLIWWIQHMAFNLSQPVERDRQKVIDWLKQKRLWREE